MQHSKADLVSPYFPSQQQQQQLQSSVQQQQQLQQPYSQQGSYSLHAMSTIYTNPVVSDNNNNHNNNNNSNAPAMSRKLYSCKDCKKCFDSPSILRTHQRTVHDTSEPLPARSKTGQDKPYVSV
ncbi:uncharacterized protein RHIMIDRAFT_258168 [Rhizopus microsporus ATCC 52813]|uniref:C2H2-type domain-containing protein n=1 Tax=Rhizopus microsporus ATCC 52813 TaxID=1340429 RepID=A0A2G4SQ77_RHIZD|nr:uncharacterized protein RHIMIDRAFT_258168 [Rhizopus microsporus ATCC 52813]PHZ10905.1 hypothetical protein RHIMIDRAFT_258168 [Rhizopus microsporus ATCC 52813]